jgi:hypothetical protein
MQYCVLLVSVVTAVNLRSEPEPGETTQQGR